MDVTNIDEIWLWNRKASKAWPRFCQSLVSFGDLYETWGSQRVIRILVLSGYGAMARLNQYVCPTRVKNHKTTLYLTGLGELPTNQPFYIFISYSFSQFQPVACPDGSSTTTSDRRAWFVSPWTAGSHLRSRRDRISCSCQLCLVSEMYQHSSKDTDFVYSKCLRHLKTRKWGSEYEL